MEHALREWARTGFGRALGTGVTARNCERSVYNWAVQETRGHQDDPSWENRMFKSRYKQKALGLLKELERGPVVSADLQVTGDRVKLNLNLVPQLVKKDLKTFIVDDGIDLNVDPSTIDFNSLEVEFNSY